MKSADGLDISVFDHDYLEKKIRCRVNTLGIQNHNQYLNILATVPDEQLLLSKELGNSHSEFFRNSATFSALEQIIIPQIYEGKGENHSQEIRIWSAGCASGQEPYSLAMLFDYYNESQTHRINYRIFATDNSAKELEKAQSGNYELKTVKNTRLELAERYMNRTGNIFTINSTLKEKIIFSNYDLLDVNSSSPPSSIYGDFDLIMCCNVLYYYKPEIQKAMLQKIYRSLNKGGFFVTGEAEAHFVNSSSKFKSYNSNTIFCKK